MLLAQLLALKTIFEYSDFRHSWLSKFICYLSRLRKSLCRYVGITLGVYDHQKYIIAAVARSDNTFESVGRGTFHLVMDKLINLFDDALYCYMVGALLGAIKGATKKENTLKYCMSLMDDRNCKLYDKRVSEWIEMLNEESLKEIIPKKEPEEVLEESLEIEFKELLAIVPMAMKVNSKVQGKKMSERKLEDIFTLVEYQDEVIVSLITDGHKWSAKICERSRKLHIQQQSSPEVLSKAANEKVDLLCANSNSINNVPVVRSFITNFQWMMLA